MIIALLWAILLVLLVMIWILITPDKPPDKLPKVGEKYTLNPFSEDVVEILDVKSGWVQY